MRAAPIPHRSSLILLSLAHLNFNSISEFPFGNPLEIAHAPRLDSKVWTRRFALRGRWGPNTLAALFLALLDRAMAIEDDIAELESLLNDAAENVTVDGVGVKFSLQEARRRLATLKRQQDATKRPRNATIDLSGF